MTLTILIALMSAFREAQADESVMLSLLLSSFTGVRGIEILRSSHNSHPIHIFTHYTASQSQLNRRW
jgi:hypothetical protein